MLFLRSLLFNIAFFSLTTVMCIAMIVTLVLPRRAVIAFVECYELILSGLERIILNLRYEIRGRENIPPAPFILAAKHQSAWETMRLHLLIKDPAVILKRELILIPLWGWYAWKAGMIFVHRNKKGLTIPSMLAGARKVVAEGRPIAIFPQGTRVAVGAQRPYKIGVGLLYKDLKIPLVPMALNAGLFWPRYSFLKKPGKVIVEFLPPIPPDLSAEKAVSVLQEKLESASDRLVCEGQESLNRRGAEVAEFIARK